MKKLFLLWLLFLAVGNIFAQQNINSFLRTYNSNIKVCNTPYAKDCLYETNYIRTTIYGNKLTIEYGFSYDQKSNDYISHNKVVVDLSTALIYTGHWWYMLGGWEHCGDKTVLTIEDKNGIDLYKTGAQSYNEGTKQNLVEYICFRFGTEPLANRALAMFQQMQQGKRMEKEPWLVVRRIEKNNVDKKTSSIQTRRMKKNSRPKKNSILKQSKSGKYVQ